MIIGLIGFKQVGKSTAANYLQEKYGFARINMKDALVAEVRRYMPLVLEKMAEEYNMTIDALFEIKPPIMRALLQNFGTELRRGENPDYWTNQWEASVSFSSNPSIVTDDIRFKNEAASVKRGDGILIRLVRPDITTGGTHASETEQLEIVADYTIECEPGGHDKLYAALDEIYEKEKARMLHLS